MADRPHIVVSLMDQGQEFQRHQAEDARRTAERLHIPVEVVFAENVAIMQIHQLFEFIQAPETERPKALLVHTVSGEGLRRVGEAAVRAGIGWVVLNRAVTYLDALRRINPNVPLGLVGPNQLEIGRLQGRQARTLLPSRDAFVLYVQGPSDTSAAQLRLEGTREVLGDVEMKLLEGRWTEASAEQAIERWCRLKRFDSGPPAVVACQNDHMAIGARRALQQFFPGQAIAVLGVDGLPEGGQQHVRAGVLDATVVVPSSTGPALEWVVQALTHKVTLPSEVILKPSSFPEAASLGFRPKQPLPASMI